MATETGEGTAEADESAARSQETAVETGTDEQVDVDEETEERYDPHARSVIVTIGSTIAGMAVALVSALYIGDPESATALLLVGAAVFIQFPLYRLIGMNVDDFGMKGKLYIAFMTFILWFLTWGIILTTGAADAL